MNCEELIDLLHDFTHFAIGVRAGEAVDKTLDVKAGWKSVNFIDKHVIERLTKLNVVPAPLCDDATFLRRVMLDLCGTLPEPQEVRAFLADRSPDKRAAKIEELLKRPEYSQWWATKLAEFEDKYT